MQGESSALTEPSLIQRARAGDPTAYRDLLARLAPAVRAYAKRRLGQEAAVEDFTQDALLAFVEAVQGDRIEDHARAGSFALGICHNLARERAKVRDRRRSAVERFADFPEVTTASEPVLFNRARLEDCISHLTGRAQRVLHGSYFQDDSDAEIAERMELSPANVRVIRHRSITALRECVEGSPDDELGVGMSDHDALARLDDYVRAAAHTDADDEAYEDDLFTRALAGAAPELVVLDSLAATLRSLGERGTLMVACGPAEAERLRTQYGARADYRVLKLAPEQEVVLSPDAEILITHVPLPLAGVDCVDIENHVEGHGLLKTFPDVVFEPGAAGLYLCCEGSLARQIAGHTVIAKFIGHRNGEKTVLLETKSTTLIASV